ncbi:IMP dehydrogenase [Patescibacteria group bacterium]|nr:IMP dehydrogenase [Patescibacteria group bacterium]
MKTFTEKEIEQTINEEYLRLGLPRSPAIGFDHIYHEEQKSNTRSRSEIQDFSTQISPHVRINIPILGANMIDVTDEKMMIALAREGGIAFPPQFFHIAAIGSMIDKTHRAECALIEKPITVRPEKTLKEAKQLMQQHNIKGLLVTDNARRLIGLLSSKDWQYELDETKLVGDLMTSKEKKRLITAPKSVSFADAEKIFLKHKKEKLPLVDGWGKVTGLITARGLFYNRFYPRALRDEKGRFLCGATIGVGRHLTKTKLKEIEYLLEKEVPIILIDTSRAWAINMEDVLKATAHLIRHIKKYANIDVAAGNVSTWGGAKFLIECGADAVKVGQGPGSQCQTRKTGTGTPQITAIIECSVVTRLYGKYCWGDGGVKTPGDIIHAIIAGANAYMLGKLIVGTEESAATAFPNKDGDIRYKTYRGSASVSVQQERQAQGNLDYQRRPEGFKEDVPVFGPLKWRLNDLLHGISSGMSFFGAKTVSELHEKGIMRRKEKE